MSHLNQHCYISSLRNPLGLLMDSGLRAHLFSKLRNPNYSSFPLVLSHTLLRLSSNAPPLGFYEEFVGCESFSSLSCHHLFVLKYLKYLPVLSCHRTLMALSSSSCIFPLSKFMSNLLHFSQVVLILSSISWDLNHHSPPVLGT